MKPRSYLKFLATYFGYCHLARITANSTDKGVSMTVEGIIGAIVIGLVLGVLGRLLAPGKQDIPIWLTIVVGIVAALIGSAIVGPMRDTNGLDWVELVVQLVLATVGVIAAASLYGRRSVHS
jgi:uncharacterized membrane protein YeaQ/YmgE (transglycosylase-associated protein family)